MSFPLKKRVFLCFDSLMLGLNLSLEGEPLEACEQRQQYIPAPLKLSYYAELPLGDVSLVLHFDASWNPWKF